MGRRRRARMKVEMTLTVMIDLARASEALLIHNIVARVSLLVVFSHFKLVDGDACIIDDTAQSFEFTL